MGKTRVRVKPRADRRPPAAVARETSRPTGSAPYGGETALWYVAALLSFWALSFTATRQGDLWWHLAAGRWMWKHKSLPWTDPWSFTRAGEPWLHHEWLADLVYYGWMRILGMPSLLYWMWGVILLTFLLLLHLLHRLSGHLVASYLATLLALVTSATFFEIRPHLYTLLAYVVLLHVLLLWPRWSWAVPLLFVLWVNVHAGFVFGLITLTVVLAITTFLRPASAAERKRAVAVWVGSLLAALVNPYGVHTLVYPFSYALDSSSPYRETLMEWLSPFSAGVQVPSYYVAIAAALGAGVWLWRARAYRDPRGLTLVGFVLTALTLAMSLRSRRFIPLFAISQSLVLAPALARVLHMLAQHVRAALGALLGHPATRLAPPLVIATISAVRLVAMPPAAALFPVMTGEVTFPVATTRFIELNRLNGPVFAHYAYGGYLQLFAPGLMTVYIDARADTVFDGDLYRRYREVSRLKAGWIDIVESSGAEYFFWPRGAGHEEALLATGRWRKLYQDPVSVLLARSTLLLTEPLRSPPDPASAPASLGGRSR